MAIYKCEHCGRGLCVHNAIEPMECQVCHKYMIKISD